MPILSADFYTRNYIQIKTYKRQLDSSLWLKYIYNLASASFNLHAYMVEKSRVKNWIEIYMFYGLRFYILISLSDNIYKYI